MADAQAASRTRHDQHRGVIRDFILQRLLQTTFIDDRDLAPMGPVADFASDLALLVRDRLGVPVRPAEFDLANLRSITAIVDLVERCAVGQVPAVGRSEIAGLVHRFVGDRMASSSDDELLLPLSELEDFVALVVGFVRSEFGVEVLNLAETALNSFRTVRAIVELVCQASGDVDRDVVLPRVRELIIQRCPEALLPDDRNVFEMGFVNSLFAMELVVFVETRFDVHVPNHELRRENFVTVAKVVDLVSRLRAESDSGSVAAPAAAGERS